MLFRRLRNIDVSSEVLSQFTHEFNGLIVEATERHEQDLLVPNLCVTGEAYFIGMVDADHTEIVGEAEFFDFFTCDDLLVSGKCFCKENVLAEAVKISGFLRISGKLHTDFLDVGGSLTVNKAVKTNTLGVVGSLSCRAKLKFERGVIKGVVHVAELLRCISLKIISDRTSVVHHLVADKLFVRQSGPEEYAEVPAFLLDCDMAECDAVDLEFCKIDRLYCQKARIGPGCMVNELFCRGEIVVSPHAVVYKVSG